MVLQVRPNRGRQQRCDLNLDRGADRSPRPPAKLPPSALVVTAGPRASNHWRGM